MHALPSRVFQFVSEPLREADRVAAAYLQNPDPAADRRMLAIVLIAALCLMLRATVLGFDPNPLLRLVGMIAPGESVVRLSQLFSDPDAGRYFRLVLWALGALAAYFFMPVLAAKLLGASLRDLGLTLPGQGDVRIYLAFFAAVVPLVALAASQPSFLRQYPFYLPPPGESLSGRFALFELLYALQFVGIEFFFRGFLIHGLKRRLGSFSILFPLVPYMMIHFGKPLPECAGALVTGLVLGFMSLRTGSIVPGVLIHMAVAVSMDFAALATLGRLF